MPHSDRSGAVTHASKGIRVVFLEKSSVFYDYVAVAYGLASIPGLMRLGQMKACKHYLRPGLLYGSSDTARFRLSNRSRLGFRALTLDIQPD